MKKIRGGATIDAGAEYCQPGRGPLRGSGRSYEGGGGGVMW